MPEDLVGVASTLGAGGALALVVFLYYRKDSKEASKTIRDDRIYTEDRLTRLLDACHKCQEKNRDTQEKNTEALTELTTLLKRMNGH